jgi:methylmalonyl-CoA mutase
LGGEAAIFPDWTEADWRRVAEAALRGKGLESLASRSADGVHIDPLYMPAEGMQPRGREGPWRVIARLDHPDASEANANALDDLSGGADGLQVVFAGATGAYGFGLRRHDSGMLHKAFDGVRFDAGSCFELDLGREGPSEAQGFAALIERSGVRARDCAVSFGLDPFAAAGFGPFPPDWKAHVRPYIEAALDLKGKGFMGPLLVADARHVHAAGGTERQELAFALGAALGLIRALCEAGLSLDEARTRFAFRLAADAEEILTLSKFRALRLMWERIEEACGLAPRKAQVQAETAWRMMTVRDQYVNVLRGATAAFSAGLGGADSVCVLPHSLAIGLPDNLARRLARNGQLILLRESSLGFVADPAAGAGAFEALTKALCDKGWSLLQEIEAKGGLPTALASGAFQSQVAESAAALKRDVARIKSAITGVSAHPDLAEAEAHLATGAPPPKWPPVAHGGLVAIRLAEPFEVLRDRSDVFARKAGARPKAYIVALGPEPAHRRRVAYIREWLETGGIEPIYEGEAATPEDAIRSFEASGAMIACLCGDDAAYAARGEAFARMVKPGVKTVILAGRPGEAEDELRAAGVDDFVFAGGDAVAGLDTLYRRLAQ